MNGRHVLALAIACVVWVATPPVVLADYYDTFDDGWWERDPNDPRYDANDPCWTDPNNAVGWDSDSPDWEVYIPLGGPGAVTVWDGWFRLWASGGGLLDLFALTTAIVDDGDPNPDTSQTRYEDATSHYILTRTKSFDDPNDPNYNRGRSCVFIMVNKDTWEGGYALSYEYYKQLNHRLYGLSAVRGMWWASMTGHWLTPRDEINGFWILFQFVSDGNPGDPNGKYLRTACWDGDKYTGWDGSYIDDVHLGADPNTFGDPNAADLYDAAGGPMAICSYGDVYWHPDQGYPSDVGFDDIEVRTGVFSRVPRTLAMQFYHGENGTVTFNPDLLADSSGDPNDPNLMRRYTDGTEVTLMAEPLPGKQFLKWKYWDPCSPATTYEDTNTVLYLTMANDWEVEAQFKCGGAALLPLGVVFLALATAVMIRRVS